MQPNARQDTMRRMYEALRRQIKPTPQELQAIQQTKQTARDGLRDYLTVRMLDADITEMWANINQSVQKKAAAGQTLVAAIVNLEQFDFIRHTTRHPRLAANRAAINNHADWVVSNATQYQQRYERYAHGPVGEDPGSPWNMVEREHIDRWFDGCRGYQKTLLDRIGDLTAAQTTLATDLAEMLRETAIEAYVIRHESAARVFVQSGFAVLTGVTNALGAAAPPAWASVPAAANFLEGIVRRVVGAGLTAYESHKFDQKHGADQGFREMNQDPTAIANRLYQGYMDHLGTMLDAVGIAMTAVPGWSIVRHAITGFVQEALDQKLAAAGDAERMAGGWLRLSPDRDSWVEKITDIIVTGIRAAAELTAEVVGVLENIAGGIAGKLVAKLIDWSPAQRVTGDDLTAASRELLATFERNLPPGIHLAGTAEKAAHAQTAYAPKAADGDRSALPRRWRDRVGGVGNQLSPTSWDVLVDGVWGTLAAAGDDGVFTPAQPDPAELTPNETWKDRTILPEQGYSAGGTVTGGVWYRPWADKQYYLLSGTPNARGHEWALGAATTANGDGSTRYNVTRMLEGKATTGFPPTMARKWQ